MAVAPMVTPAALPTTIAFQCRFTRTVNHRLAAAIPPLITRISAIYLTNVLVRPSAF